MGLPRCDEQWARLVELEKVKDGDIRAFLTTCSAEALELITFQPSFVHGM
jgi:hypothetical protein